MVINKTMDSVMKKFMPFILIFLLFIPTKQFAQGLDFSIYGGKDFCKIKELRCDFQLMDMTEASINREGFKNPWILGIDLGINFSKGFKVDLSAEAAYLKYKLYYSRNYPTVYNPFNIKTSSYKVEWARIAFLTTLEKILFSSQITELYVGLGSGLHIVAPVVSDKFLFNTLIDKFMELDPSTDVNLKSKFGGHVIFGFQVNPLSNPIKFKLEGKYTIMPEGDYEEPNTFFTVYLGILYSFDL